jgi:hypothetical protein
VCLESCSNRARLMASRKLQSIFPNAGRVGRPEMQRSTSTGDPSVRGSAGEPSNSSGRNRQGTVQRDSLNLQGRDSSADTTNHGSYLHTVSDFNRESWDFDKAETAAPTTSMQNTLSSSGGDSGNIGGHASNWSFAVMDYNDLDKNYELPITASRGARW